MKFREQLSDINSEFERLKQLASTKEGMRKITQAWREAAFNETELRVAGFAIDVETGEYKLGAPSKAGTHDDVYQEFIQNKEHSSKFKNGRAVYTPMFKFPLIIVSGITDMEEIEEIDNTIVQKKIGLPISALYRRYKLNLNL